MEIANQQSTARSRSKQRNYLYDSQVTQLPDSYEERPEVLSKTPQFKTGLQKQLWPAEIDAYPDDQVLYGSDKNAKNQLNSNISVSTKANDTLRRDPKFQPETDVPESERDQQSIRDRIHHSKYNSVSGQVSELPTINVSSTDLKPEQARSDQAAPEFSPTSEIQETKEEIKRLKVDVDELKHKIDGLSSHNSSFVRNNEDDQGTAKNRSSAYLSPTRSYRGSVSQDQSYLSNLASDLDENITAIKQDLANILNNTMHLISPKGQQHLLKTPSTASSNRINGTSGDKSSQNQQHHSPTDNLLAKELCDPSVSNPTFGNDKKDVREQSPNKENAGHQSQHPETSSSEKSADHKESKSCDTKESKSLETPNKIFENEQIKEKLERGSESGRIQGPETQRRGRESEKYEDHNSTLSKSSYTRKSREDPPDLSKNLERARSFSLTKRFTSRNSIAQSIEGRHSYAESLDPPQRSASVEVGYRMQQEKAKESSNDDTPNLHKSIPAKSIQPQYQQQIEEEEIKNEELKFSWVADHKDGRSLSPEGNKSTQSPLRKSKLKKHQNLSPTKREGSPGQELSRNLPRPSYKDKETATSPERLSQNDKFGTTQGYSTDKQQWQNPMMQIEKLQETENHPFFEKGGVSQNPGQKSQENSQKEQFDGDKLRENFNAAGANFMAFPQQPQQGNMQNTQNLQDGGAFNPYNLAMLAQMGVPWEYVHQLLIAQASQMQQEEMKKYMEFIMNFYEFHLANMKNIITNQTETLNDQAKRMNEYAGLESQYMSKIIALEGKLQEQHLEHEKRYLDLNQRYEIYMNELLKNRQNADVVYRTIQNEANTYSPDRSALLEKEINHIKRELESQKDLIRELANAKLRLEHQIIDIEQAYKEDVMMNSFVTKKQEQLQQALQGYQDNYRRLEMMNRNIMQAYDRTKSDLDMLRSANAKDQCTDELGKLTRDLQNMNRMQSPQTYQPNEVMITGSRNDARELSRERIQLLEKKFLANAQQNNSSQREVLRRVRQDEDHVKDILSWQSHKGNSKYSLENSDRPTEYASNFKNPQPYMNKNDESNYSVRGNRFNETRKNPEDSSYFEPQSNNSFIMNEREIPNQKYYQAPTTKSIKESQIIPEKTRNNLLSNQQSNNRLTFPSQQRYEDNLEEIAKLHRMLTELVSQKQAIENCLIKMPATGRTLAEKRKKAALEKDLDAIESAIDEVKGYLKELDAFLVE